MTPTRTTLARASALPIAALAISALTPAAHAQEAMYTQAATMPSPNTGVVRLQYHMWIYGSNPEAGTKRTEKLEAMHSIAYGLARDWALFIDAPMEASRSENASTGDWSSDKSMEGLDAIIKWRFYQHDGGGVNTERAALIFGTSIDNAQDDDWEGLTVNPKLGGVFTIVRGRHGFNQDLIYQLNTGGDEADNFGGEGPSDALFFNSAYVYRIIPTQFSSDTNGAWYVTAELNGLYETNGDVELRWSPGLMYEGRRFAFELMAQFPLWQDVDHRAELDFGFGFGFRFTF